MKLAYCCWMLYYKVFCCSFWAEQCSLLLKGHCCVLCVCDHVLCGQHLTEKHKTDSGKNAMNLMSFVYTNKCAHYSITNCTYVSNNRYMFRQQDALLMQYHQQQQHDTYSAQYCDVCGTYWHWIVLPADTGLCARHNDSFAGTEHVPFCLFLNYSSLNI